MPTTPPISPPLQKGRLPWTAQHAPTPVETYPLNGNERQINPSESPHHSHNRSKMKSACRWLHSLFLAVDANFRLKLKNRGIKDPDIGSGWSYFVESRRYIEHLSQNTNAAEVS